MSVSLSRKTASGNVSPAFGKGFLARAAEAHEKSTIAAVTKPNHPGIPPTFLFLVTAASVALCVSFQDFSLLL
jgi:hypothetical protein